MLGGGTYVTQNKVLPGAYINFVSTGNGVDVFGERGTGAVAAYGNWFTSTGVITVTKEDFQKYSKKIFGYDYTDDNVLWVRDFFKHGKTLLWYPINQTNVARASNTFATAKGYGSRGNALKTVIQVNVDDTGKYDVSTYFDTELVDIQTVASASELVDNDYCTFKSSATLVVTAGESFANGKTGGFTSSNIQNWLNRMENYTFNAITLLLSGSDYQALVAEWTIRMRDEVGKKFQAVINADEEENPDFSRHEGVIFQYNYDSEYEDESTAWLCGACAGCNVNESLTNMLYDGEMEFYNIFTQSELEELIEKGLFVFHRVNDECRVLMDINSLIEYTDKKGSVFSSNQTIRICDQIAMDIATIFNNYYLGKVQNDEVGRTSFRGKIINHHNTLVGLRAITDFDSEDVTVEIGEDKGSVVVNDVITPVNAMDKLYMQVVVN